MRGSCGKHIHLVHDGHCVEVPYLTTGMCANVHVYVETSIMYLCMHVCMPRSGCGWICRIGVVQEVPPALYVCQAVCGCVDMHGP